MKLKKPQTKAPKLIILFSLTISLAILFHLSKNIINQNQLKKTVDTYAAFIPITNSLFDLYFFTEREWVGDYYPTYLLCKKNTLDCKKVYGQINSLNRSAPIHIYEEVPGEKLLFTQRNMYWTYFTLNLKTREIFYKESEIHVDDKGKLLQNKEGFTGNGTLLGCLIQEELKWTVKFGEICNENY